jgi:hypothetical protein
MEIKINKSCPAPTSGRKVVTFREAEELGAFELARQWANRLSWPALERSAPDDLAELAYMSALARWLTRWRPILIHRAVLEGAEPTAVAVALGGSIDEAFHCWHRWAVRQCGSLIGGKPGVTAEDYEAVMRAFAAAGVIVASEEPRRD